MSASTAAGPRTQPQSPPPAFLCTSSKQVMRDPVLALCGHLFEKTVAESVVKCSVDHQPIFIKDCIPFKELQKTIDAWRGRVSSPGDLGDLDDRLCRVHIQEGATEEKKGPPNPARPPVRPLAVVKNAHDDDIHGFVSISPECFVSGSKDNTIKMWDVNGTLIQSLATNTSETGYEYWVTALSKFSNGLWASGTRDGYVTIWNQRGQQSSSFGRNPSKVAGQQPVCKARNKSRINCITELKVTDQVTMFYTGIPKCVQVWDGKAKRVLREYPASTNDWVYCIEVLDNQDLLVVIGSNLEYWNMKSTVPGKQKLIQETAQQHSSQQRPHISAITRLEHDRNQLSSALFDGTVKIVDIAARRLVHDYNEHTGRVWSVMNLSPHILASSADDKTIKVWDIRQQRSTLTIGGNPGRVSSLLRLSDTVLISGSCPDNLRFSKEKASITFWDIRKII